MNRFRPCGMGAWRPTALVLMLALCIAGCGPGGSGDEVASDSHNGTAGDAAGPGGVSGAAAREPAGESAGVSTRRDSAGVVLITSYVGRWRPGDRWRLEADLTLGALDGSDAFQAVRSLAIDAAGGMYVLDGDARVRAFAADGTPRGAFGGRGGGPGEFRHPSSVGVTEAGRVAVGETYPPALHWLTPDGKLLGTLSPPPMGASPTAAVLSTWSVSRSGAAFVELAAFDPARTDGWPTVLLRWRAGATHPDTAARWMRPTAHLDRIRLFEPTHAWAIAADGSLYLAPGARYEVRVFAPSGELNRILRRDVRPRTVTAAMRERAVVEVRGWMKGEGAAATPVDPERVRIEAASVLPAVERIWVSEPDGGLWVGVLNGGPGSSFQRPGAYDVFDSAGRYLGRIPAPPGFELLRVTPSAAYGRWKDELDVPYVRRYRIVRPWTRDPVARSRG